MDRLSWCRFAAAVAFVLAISCPGSVPALERTTARAIDSEAEVWNAAASCTVRYYNNCTGWVWVWSGWSPGERIGTAFHGCCQSAVLQLTNHLTFDGVASGWGFTGTIEVLGVDAQDCPVGPALARQAWLPPLTDGWWSVTWNVPVPPDFFVRIDWKAPIGFTNRSAPATDHPAAGPTGPQACGTCFPSTRVVHSYQWDPGDQSCPGTVLNDGVCDVEWAMDARLSCTSPTEQESWGGIKGLYR